MSHTDFPFPEDFSNDGHNHNRHTRHVHEHKRICAEFEALAHVLSGILPWSHASIAAMLRLSLAHYAAHMALAGDGRREEH